MDERYTIGLTPLSPSPTFCYNFVSWKLYLTFFLLYLLSLQILMVKWHSTILKLRILGNFHHFMCDQVQ